MTAAAEKVTPSTSAAATTPESGAAKASSSDLDGILARMRKAARKSGPPDYDQRIEHLDKLERVLLDKKHDLVKAVSSDYGNRSKHETLVGEVMVVINEIKHVRAHLHEWMESEPREVNWMFLPGRAEVVMQPVGVVGIVSPWNYPIQLSLAPLVGALAAGNRVIIKPSEIASETAEALKELIATTFASDHVTVVTGGPDVAEKFTRLPLDHLVFTGSTRLGKIVMKAAAENLVPVTLELGGKSPAIIGEGYSIQKAATKIMFGKCFNAGQTCIAPDYVLVPKGHVDAFVEECRKLVGQMYPKLGENGDYTSIVSSAHYDRLQSYLTDARERGAKIVDLHPAKEDLDASSRKMAPVIVLQPKEEMIVMQEEIFGPILPVIPYEKLDEAIDYVNDHARPLALYYFDDNQRRIDRVLRETVAGGVSINETLFHIAQSDLPFGGIGPSGIGAYHGREGFDALTKKKPVFYQSRINASALLHPPFSDKLDWALKTLLGK